MGLTGPEGFLPNSLHQFDHRKGSELPTDRFVTCFSIFFNHRVISLFYRAWRKYSSTYRLSAMNETASPGTFSVLWAWVPMACEDRMAIPDEQPHLLLWSAIAASPFGASFAPDPHRLLCCARQDRTIFRRLVPLGFGRAVPLFRGYQRQRVPRSGNRGRR